MQHHANHRPARPAAPVSTAPRRLGDEPAALQKGLGPGVAPGKAMPCLEVLVKMLGGETVIALAIEPLHFRGLAIGHRSSRSPSNTVVDQPLLAIFLKAPRPPPECPLTHPKYLCRLQLAQPSG